jgi:hypothetical protein
MAYIGDVAVYRVAFPQSRIPGGNTRPHKDGANAVVAVQPGDVLDSIDINT